MLYRDICKVVGLFLFGLAIALCIPFIVAVYYQYIASPDIHPQPHTTWVFFVTICITLVLGGIVYSIGRHQVGHLYRREGLVAVTAIWFLASLIGALPFYISGTLDNPFQAFFEAASGYTTTGSTVMIAKKYDPETGEEIPIVYEFSGVNPKVYRFYGTITPVRDPKTGKILFEGIEAVSKPLLFWRNFIQWLGGMGIIVLFAAILPLLGVGGKMLFQAEVTGPLKESLTPRIRETAYNLWKIYLFLTVLEVVFLMLTNPLMSSFEAITISFSSISTGGFSTKNASIGYYDNIYTQIIIMIFMIVGSINFSLYFYTLRGKFYRIYEPEISLYLIILISSCLFVSWYIVGSPKQLLTGGLIEGVFSRWEALRYGFFQVISVQTSTGFTTANYDIWPNATLAVMLILMFIGGMSGSTAGGMKVIRSFMLFRIVQYKIESLFRPQTVRNLRISGREMDMSAITLVLCFYVVIISIAVLNTFIYVLEEIDLETAIGLTACNLNNVGTGFRMYGPLGSCAFLSNFGLMQSAFLMILGRLEFFAILAILVPSFWKKTV